MPNDQIKVKTLCGVDVLGDNAIAIALWTTHPVPDSTLDPKAIGDRDATTQAVSSRFGAYTVTDGESLNAAMSLDQAVAVRDHLSMAIEELSARQAVTRG